MKKTLFIITAALGLLAAQSCNKIDSEPIYRAEGIATVPVLKDGEQLKLRLNDTITLVPNNITRSPYKKEVRAYLVFTMDKDHYTKGENEVSLLAIDSIRTKNVAPNLGIENANVYGSDYVDIVDSWETCVEDGYLTLRFRTYWGIGDIVHVLNLVQDTENPQKFHFYHNANHDGKVNQLDRLIAFKLPDLPSTGTGEESLILTWNSPAGPKTTTFKYQSK